MSLFVLVALLPDDPVVSAPVGFLSRQIDTIDGLGPLLAEVEATNPRWRLVRICDVEDLPDSQASLVPGV